MLSLSSSHARWSLLGSCGCSQAGVCPVARCACTIFHAPSSDISRVAEYLAMSSLGVPLYVNLSWSVKVTTATFPPAMSVHESKETHSLDSKTMSVDVIMPFHVAWSIGLPEGRMTTASGAQYLAHMSSNLAASFSFAAR